MGRFGVLLHIRSVPVPAAVRRISQLLPTAIALLGQGKYLLFYSLIDKSQRANYMISLHCIYFIVYHCINADGRGYVFDKRNYLVNSTIFIMKLPQPSRLHVFTLARRH
jgi:hypothetical protein